MNREETKNLIISLLNSDKAPLTREEIANLVGIYNLNIINEILSELQNDGKLVISKKKKVMLPSAMGLVPCIISRRCLNFSFASQINGGEDIYIENIDCKNALPGDTVFLHNVVMEEKGLAGQVERVLKRTSRAVTGIVIYEYGRCCFLPDMNYNYSVFVEKGFELRTKNLDKVQAILFFDSNDRLNAKIVKVYGTSESARICSDSIIDKLGIPTEFSGKAIKEAKEIEKTGVQPEDYEGRLDLRNLPILTIDGADAKDLDDAVSVSKNGSGWILGVHIADVSHYVVSGSALDEDARTRGTSVYFADRVIPMLPKEISNGVCSLNAHEDKLTFSAMLNIDEKGNLKDYNFCKSVINSKVRGVYSEVNEIFDGTATQELKNKYKPVINTLKEGRILANLLKEKAKKRGDLDIQSGELKFILDEKGVCIGVSPRESGEAQELIEQFMIMANQAAALYAKSASIPFIYRVHEQPNLEKLDELSELVAKIGMNNRRLIEGVRPNDFAELLKNAEDTPFYTILSRQVLRTMAKAKYSPNPIGHFGLSLKDYCHFTSPIRRYPDTSIHRILTDLISDVPIDMIQKKYSEFVISASNSSTECEIRAMRGERDTEKCYAAEYMRSFIGEEYEGIITGASNKGVFVTIDCGIEGFVNLISYENYSFQFDGWIGHIDKYSGKKFFIGDKVKIKVIGASVAMGTVDFDLVGI